MCVCTVNKANEGTSLTIPKAINPKLSLTIHQTGVKCRIITTVDVREMCRMLRLPESDQAAIRFLWRESPSEEHSVYQF